jgi:hypothetical protein
MLESIVQFGDRRSKPIRTGTQALKDAERK